MTKYCTKSFYGTVDNKIVLDLEDDAPYVNMGTEWRMSTYEELDELNIKCTWTTQNGTKGYGVTGPNGKSIFLSAAGFRIDSNLCNFGSGCNYWSASLHESTPGSAWYLIFISGSHYPYCINCYYGHVVCAVVR